MLANSLYLQAMISLGVLPNPLSKKTEVRLPQAKYSIDMLEILREKTEGNRTAEETEDFEAMLHQLRLAYLAAAEKGEGIRGSGDVGIRKKREEATDETQMKHGERKTTALSFHPCSIRVHPWLLASFQSPSPNPSFPSVPAGVEELEFGFAAYSEVPFPWQTSPSHLPSRRPSR